MKEKLEYVKQAYPEVYGTRVTLEISPYRTEDEIRDNASKTITNALGYRFTVPKSESAKDTRQIHHRWYTTDGLVVFSTEAADKPDNVLRLTLKTGQTHKIDIDTTTQEGLEALAFFIENPYYKTVGIENKFLLTAPLFEVKIRGNVIRAKYENINELAAIYNEVLDLGLNENQEEAKIDVINLCAFMGVPTINKTIGEMTIDLLGENANGVIFNDKPKYRKYMSMNKDEKEIEVLVAKAIEHGFIKNTDEGFKLDDTTPLGSSLTIVVNYFKEKKGAMNKLRDRVDFVAEKQETIADVQDIADNTKEKRTTTRQSRNATRN